MNNVTFTTTAVNRPEILEKTYRSFSKNLRGIDLKECKLCINIDPLPSKKGINNVLEVCDKYFGEVKYNMPDEGNFTRAYNWIWSAADTEYIFNLEDDWSLTKKIDFTTMIKFFETSDSLLQVALRAYKYRYQICPLSPSLIHERYYKQVAGKLDETLNPEIQLRGDKFGILLPCKENKISAKGRLLVYPESGEIVLKDIGRNWLRNTKFRKPKGKAHFTTWI